MVDTVYGVNAVSGAPSYSGKQYRQANSAAYSGATSARPLGGGTGVRPGTSTSTVTATSTVWTCGPFAGVADVETAAEASLYPFAFDANATGAVTAAHATLARVDIVYVQIDDPSESDGSSVPAVTRKYLAGTASGTPTAPVPPVSRAFVVAEINVPASGGGSPTVTWVAPYCAAAGGVVPFLSKARMDASVRPVGTYADVFADSTASSNGLYRSDGSAWASVGVFSEVNISTFSTGWTATSGHVPRVGRQGGVFYLVGAVTLGASGNISSILTVPTAYRPPSAGSRFIGSGTASNGVSFTVLISGGVVQIPAGYLSGATPNGTVIPLMCFWTND